MEYAFYHSYALNMRFIVVLNLSSFCPGFGFHVSKIVQFFWPKNGKCPGFR